MKKFENVYQDAALMKKALLGEANESEQQKLEKRLAECPDLQKVFEQLQNGETLRVAFEEYKNWQRATLGRDINPDELIKLVKNAGAKRLTITSPTYTTVSENEVAKCSATVITYRGLE